MRFPRALPLGAVLWALAVGGSGGAGCRKGPDAPDAGAESVGTTEGAPTPRPGSRRMEVKVPLPPGWSAQSAEDGGPRFGPPHHPVLRVDLRTGEGGALPSAEALGLLVTRAFAGLVRTGEQLEEGEDFVMVRLTLAPRLGDGGVGESHPAFLGARRVDRDLFLCASLPGASADEVREGAGVCRAIHVEPPAR